jgi:hypothetical protein
MSSNINFTHLWVDDFGWETTIFLPNDFDLVELLGESEQDGKVFLAIQDNGKKRIFKGKVEEE